MGICPVCRKEKLFGKEKTCILCKAWHSEYNHKYYAKNKEKLIPENRQRNRSMYARRKEQGLCTKCGSKYLKPGKTKCYMCCQKDIEQSRRYYLKKMESRVANG